jgi:hypothetical protein
VRGLHAFCVNFTPRELLFPRKTKANTLGMVSVKHSGLIMKLRGMIFGLSPSTLALPCLCFSLPERFFIFPFDRGWSFL